MRKIFYTYSATETPADPTINSTEYTGALPYANGYYKAIARDGNVLSTVTSKGFGMAPADYVAYYPFDGNTNDHSGNGYNLTNNGAILTTGKDGLADTAYDFTGNSTSYFMINSTPIPTTHNMTVCFKLYARGYGSTNPNNSGVGVVVKANDFGYQHDFTVNIANTNGNKSIQLISGNNSGQYKNAEYISNTLPIDSWFSICIVRNDNSIYFYIDSVLVYTDSISFIVTDKGMPLTIGRNPSNTIQSFDGKIDELKIFNRALTQDEINLL